MWVLGLIPLTVIVLICIYQFVILPKMKATQNAKMNALASDFALQIAGREAAVIKDFIQTNEHIKPIAFQINDQNIIGIISCQQKREGKDMVRQQAVHIAGKVLERFTGVGVKEEDNGEHYFLVLTDNNLHYLHYSETGHCKAHISFERSELQKVEVGKITSMDSLKNAAFVGETERLSFESDGVQYKFFFYNKIFGFQSIANTRIEDLAKSNYLFAKPFLDFVDNYRPD